MNFLEMREKMVDCQIRPSHVLPVEVLNAFLDTPRETFTPLQLQHIAYMDSDFPLDHDRVMFRTCDLAGMINAVDLKLTDTVLYVGSNTGYGLALLAPLCSHITALECEATLVTQSEKALKPFGFKTIEIKHQPLTTIPDATFDVIFVEGKIESGTDVFTSHLNEGGRMIAVCPSHLGTDEVTLFTKIGSSLSQKNLFTKTCPPLPGLTLTPTFHL